MTCTVLVQGCLLPDENNSGTLWSTWNIYMLSLRHVSRKGHDSSPSRSYLFLQR